MQFIYFLFQEYYFSFFQTEITWLFSIMAGVGTIVWLWNHMSHKHLIFVVVIGLYLYEVFTSYKVNRHFNKAFFL